MSVIYVIEKMKIHQTEHQKIREGFWDIPCSLSSLRRIFQDLVVPGLVVPDLVVLMGVPIVPIESFLYM
jgi:hypothetical protein